jgi:methionyl-tRNA formyltransferase
MKNRVTLFLMSYKGYYVLERLLSEFGPQIIDKVISSKDPYIKKDYYDEIKELAQSSGISFFDRRDYFESSEIYSIAVSWKWLIEKSEKLIVLHDSLLPKYRGFAPLVNCIVNKEINIGVTAIFANEEYDTGNIISQKSIEISYPIKIFEAINKITPLYYEIIKEIIWKINNGITLNSTSQKSNDASYSLWLDEEDYEIDWAQDAGRLKRLIDATGFPFLGAYGFIGTQKVRILEAEECEDVKIENRTPGKVIFLKEGKPVVVCGKGLLLINKLIDDKTSNDLLPFQKLKVRFR